MNALRNEGACPVYSPPSLLPLLPPFSLCKDILFIVLVAEGMLVTYATPKEHTLTAMGKNGEIHVRTYVATWSYMYSTM